MDPVKEMAAKLAHDPHLQSPSVRQVFLPGPLIVGAGPSGLAVAACLKERGIPRVILERAHCLGSLWKFRTYDRLRLHLPKQFCQLPYLPFPDHYPTYPSKEQFSTYLDSYAQHFNLQPVYGRAVVKAEYDSRVKVWRVRATGPKKEMIEYVCKWLIVATGENAEAYEPEFEGRDKFVGPIIHSTEYKSGHEFNGKKVLVVGCGNSGMELCLDLCNHNAYPSMVVRDSVHILPQEILGVSTFGMSMWLLKWFPLKVVDQILLLISRLMLGDTSQLGIDRPTIGPLQYKNFSGKTPVLDVGTLAQVKAGNIKVFPGIKRFTRQGVEFVDGRTEYFDVIILATGYKSNVPSWLQDTTMFSKNDGYPVKQFPNGWKGEKGLYAVGFTKRGLLGITHDAIKIAQDIERDWITQAKHLISTKINLLSKQSNDIIEDNYF